MNSNSDLTTPHFELEHPDRLSYLYLFITDIIALLREDYRTYAQKEPGFAAAYFNGYLYAFRQPAQRVSHKLILGIHKAAMDHHQETDPAGKYRTDKNNVSYHLTPGITKNENGDRFRTIPYNVTPEGFDALIHKWFVNISPSKQTHSLMFEKNNEQTLLTFIPMTQKLYWANIATHRPEIFDQQKHIQLMHQLLHDHNCQKQLSTQALPDYTVRDQVQDWMDAYNNDINHADTDEKKLAVIVQHIQWLNQIHPFYDGNVRTCYILLNKLLSDHQLSLCILLNPNQFDACDLAELIRMVKIGQALYQRLLLLQNSKKPISYLEVPNDVLLYKFKDNKIVCSSEEEREAFFQAQSSDVSKIRCLPIDLGIPNILAEFCQHVLKIDHPQKTLEKKSTATASTSPSTMGLYKAAPTSLNQVIKKIRDLLALHHDADSKSIQEAITIKDYGLALRRACAKGKFSIIDLLLKNVNTLKIDINQESPSTHRTPLDWIMLFKISTEQEDKTQIDAIISQLRTIGAMTHDEKAQVTAHEDHGATTDLMPTHASPKSFGP